MPNDYFSSTVVIITGAASGIGRELALQAASRGASVLACDINESGLKTTVKLAKDGSNLEYRILDVGNQTAVADFAESVIPSLNGKKLVLVNNAGVALLSGHFATTDLEDMEWLFNINFWGTVRMTKAFLPYFLEQNAGHIVNISSLFGLGGFSNQSAYSPSKFAVRGFTEVLRMELIETGIVMTSVHPGGIKTDIVKNARINDEMGAGKDQLARRFEQLARTGPAEAARQVLRAVEKSKERLLIGSDARSMDWLIRLFPVLYSKIIKKLN